MGSGLSMTSVNKIKELAAAREYSLALEIIDSQDLSKSLNPQFIRLCGDVYIANGRYTDARRVLLMAHRMAPEAKRVIYSLVDLYLRMGYKDLSDFYYRLYMFDAEPNLPQTDQIKYIYDKAQGCPFQEIETLLFPMYSDVMDYDWSFELYLLMKVQGKEAEAEAIKSDYIASYKNEPNVLLIDAIDNGELTVEDLFYIYSKETVLDDSPEEEDLRQQEKPLLEADELRMNPKEAEIQILFDDNEKASLGAKLKYKRHLKEQEKLAKKASDGELPLEDDEQEQKASEDSNDVGGHKVEYSDASENNDGTVETEESHSKVNILKKLFTKKKSENLESSDGIMVSEDTTTVEETGESEESEVVEVAEVVEETEAFEELESVEETEAFEELESVEEAEAFEELESVEEAETFEELESVEKAEAFEELESVEETEAFEELETSEEPLDRIEDSYVQEIHSKKKISISSELGEDSFDDSGELEFDFQDGDSFDEINNDEESYKTNYIVEEVQLQPEEDELDVDDFSQDLELSGFDEGFAEAFDEALDVHRESEEVLFDIENDEIEEESVESESEDLLDYDTDVNSESEYEFYNDSEIVDNSDDDILNEVDNDLEVDDMSEFYGDILDFTTDDVGDVESELEVDEEVIAEDVSEEEIPGSDDVYNVYKTTSILEGESVYNAMKEKGRMEFPEFKTSLFPEYGKEIVEVKNNFDEIMTSAQDKINENLLKEEQMQKEAEAILASLGIDLGDIKPTINAEDAKLGFEKRIENTKDSVETTNKGLEGAVSHDVPEEVELKVSDSDFESLVEPEDYYRPSRDELKSSLKIDSVKKSILKQIKEYR